MSFRDSLPGFPRKRKSPSPYDRINIDDDDEMIIEGYQWSLARSFIFWLLVLLSAGFILILTTWKPGYRIRLSHLRCALDQADRIVLRDTYGEEYVETVVKPDYTKKERAQFSYFYHKKIKYIWRPELSQFTKLKGLEKEKCGNIYSMSDGLTNSDAQIRQSLYGSNSIIIEVEPITKLILNQIGNPFYVYQIFIILVWMIQLYYQFSGCVLLFSIISISLHVHETRKQSTSLRQKVHSESEIVVLREGNMTSRSSTELVPGDVIILAPNCSFVIECDAVLISGSCTADESMLTGESLPISKVALTEDPNILYSPSSHKKNTLFCGTEILHVQSSDKIHVKALVVRTGYSTTKGELVRNILFPKPVNFQLKQDLIKCMIFFFILGIPSMAYTAYIFSSLGANLYDTIIIVIDIATFLVPPLLPAVMTSINAYAQKRLRKADIYCLDTNFISAGGGIDMVCFDKTGTLTEDLIDVAGAIPCVAGFFGRPERDLKSLDKSTCLVATILNCHSLIQRNKRIDGDRQEVRMFEAIDGEFRDDSFVNENGAFDRLPERIVGFKNAQGEQNLIYGLIRQFPFDSTLQRMTVIVKRAHSKQYMVLMKGAPEMVRTFCIEATVPSDFEHILGTYTRDGMRVIAAASKLIEGIDVISTLNKIPREDFETGLTFDGLIVFQNALKPETTPTLSELNQVGIRTIMATGDNILTALSVARNCGMIDEADSVVQVEASLVEGHLETTYRHVKLPGISEKIALDRTAADYGNDTVMMMTPMIKKSQSLFHISIEGRSFELIRVHDRPLLAKIVHKGTIFARMLPDHKLHLIDEIQRQGHQVAMCGDGANDCGALRMANCGISLSLAESSVASPFTYTKKNIECVPILIREGRATLSATIGAFKYQASYCFVLLSAVLILFWEGQKTSDGGFVMIDIVLNVFPPLVFGTTKAFPRLTRHKPNHTLFGFLPLFSIFSFVFIQIVIYLIAREYLIIQEWYEPFTFNSTMVNRPEPSHMALSILSVNTMSYIIAAIIFTPGPPFRKSFLSNKIYTGVVLLNFALVFIVTVYPCPKFLLSYINFKDVPDYEFKLTLFALSLANFGISYIWEVIILQGSELALTCKRFNWRSHEPLYKQIETELRLQDDWPPVFTSQQRKRARTGSMDTDNWIHHCSTLPVDHRIGETRIGLDNKRTLVTFTQQEYNVESKVFD